MSQNRDLEKDLEVLSENLHMSYQTKNELNKTYASLQVNEKASSLKPVKRYAGVALACTLVLCIIGTFNPLIAKEIPMLYKIFEGLNHTIFKGTPYEKYAEPKQLSVKDKGLEVIIEEVFCDQREFGYTYTIKSQKDKLRVDDSTYETIRTGEELMIDGEPFKMSSRYSGGEYIDDYTYTGENIYESDMLLPEQFELQIIFQKFHTVFKPTFEQEGKWKFKTTVTKHTTPDSYVVQPNLEFKINQPTPSTLKISDIGITPISSYITLETPRDEEITYLLNYYELDFALVDSLGQTYIPGKGGMHLTEEDWYEWYLTFSIPEEVPEWIGIVPSIIPLDEGGMHSEERVIKTAYEGNLPVVIERAGVGDYQIIEIREENGSFIVKAKLDPLQPHQGLGIELKNGDQVWMEEILEEKSDVIEIRYEGCKIKDIAYFVLRDSGEYFDMNQMIKVPLTEGK